jgi:poly-gamma-glutamate synthesis protein (capsule biosynthesis protein)
MAFTGDFLLHNRVTGFAAEHAADDPTRDYDYRPLLEPIRPWIEGADWAVCHMEVNLSADGTRLRPFPMFRSPGQIAFDARDLGYDSCSVASNHILDHGIAGVNETLGVLDDASLDSTGAARTAEEARDQIWFDIGGVLVAHLSYAYGFNGFLIPDDAPWLTNQIAAERILADATRAREAGAEVVILSLHWGEQYQIPPNSQQRELGLSLLSSPDIDLIIGHHAHVAQTIEHQDGEWLVYGLGNLLANYSQAVRRDELLVEVTFTEQADGGFDSELMAVPLYVEWGTLTVYPSSPGGRSAGAGPALDAELDASWERVLDTLRSGSGWEHLLLG